MEYRELKENEICRELFKDFIRRQEVKKCWRKEEGTWVVRDVPFIDDWSEADYQTLTACLKNTAAAGGLVYAFFMIIHIPAGSHTAPPRRASGYILLPPCIPPLCKMPVFQPRNVLICKACGLLFPLPICMPPEKVPFRFLFPAYPQQEDWYMPFSMMAL